MGFLLLLFRRFQIHETLSLNFPAMSDPSRRCSRLNIDDLSRQRLMRQAAYLVFQLASPLNGQLIAFVWIRMIFAFPWLATGLFVRHPDSTGAMEVRALEVERECWSTWLAEF